MQFPNKLLSVSKTTAHTHHTYTVDIGIHFCCRWQTQFSVRSSAISIHFASKWWQNQNRANTKHESFFFAYFLICENLKRRRKLKATHATDVEIISIEFWVLGWKFMHERLDCKSHAGMYTLVKMFVIFESKKLLKLLDILVSLHAHCQPKSNTPARTIMQLFKSARLKFCTVWFTINNNSFRIIFSSRFVRTKLVRFEFKSSTKIVSSRAAQMLSCTVGPTHTHTTPKA